MRFMLTFESLASASNELIRSGQAGPTIQAMIEQVKPEAVYFGSINGNRGGYVVINVNDPAEIPPIVEPLYLQLEAKVTLVPIMTPEELAAGIANLPTMQ